LSEWPTAIQTAAAVHDTRTSCELLAPAGVGTVWSDHFVPFQPSANVTPKEKESPTAVQALADAHDTPESTLSRRPAGFGVGWVSHTAPFQCSASVRSPPATLR
jgi:hypothetical protein